MVKLIRALNGELYQALIWRPLSGPYLANLVRSLLGKPYQALIVPMRYISYQGLIRQPYRGLKLGIRLPGQGLIIALSEFLVGLTGVCR